MNAFYVTHFRDQIRCDFFISIVLFSSPNPMYYILLESSHRDDSNKWSNIGFYEEIMQVESIECYLMYLIMSHALVNAHLVIVKHALLLACCTSVFLNSILKFRY